MMSSTVVFTSLFVAKAHRIDWTSPSYWALFIALVSWLPALRLILERTDAQFLSLINAAVIVTIGILVNWRIGLGLFRPNLNNRLDRILIFLRNSPLFAGVIILLTTVMVVMVFPIADARSEIGRGSDADDAVVVSANALWEGKYPYSEKTYLGHPISTGPGWLILISPFGQSKTIYPFLVPTVFLLVVLGIRKITGGWASSGNLAFLVGISPAFWEASAIGHDLPAVGLLLAFVVLIWSSQPVRSKKNRTLTSILSIALITSRIPFAIAIPFLAFAPALGVARRFRQPELIITIAIVAALNLVFYAWGQGVYPPTHTFGHLYRQMGSFGFQVAAAGYIFVFLLVSLAPPMTRNGFLRFSALSITGLVLLHGIGRLIRGELNLSIWDVSSTFAIAVPILILAATSSTRIADNR